MVQGLMAKGLMMAWLTSILATVKQLFDFGKYLERVSGDLSRP
jgi:hypothetical protein